MTDSEKIAYVQALTNNNPKATDTLVSAFLTKAKAVVLRRLDPMNVAGLTDVPDIYEVLQCELATRYFFRMGGEAEMSHAEDGVNRSYHSTNDEELLREIIPFAKVVG